MNQHYDQLVAGLEAIANDAAGIEAFDRLDHFEDRINAEVDKFKALDALGAGIEDSGRICLKDVMNLEKSFPGIIYNEAMIHAQFTVMPSQQGVTAALEAIDWKKAGKWGLIGAIIAAIIAIIAKIVGSRGKDDGVAEQAAKATEGLDDVVTKAKAAEQKTETQTKAAQAAHVEPAIMIAFNKAVDDKKNDRAPSTPPPPPPAAAGDHKRMPPPMPGNHPKPPPLPGKRPAQSNGDAMEQIDRDNKRKHAAEAAAHNAGRAEKATALNESNKAKRIDDAAHAFNTLSKYLFGTSGYDFKNSALSKKWTPHDVIKLPSLLPQVRSLDAWAPVRSTFLWNPLPQAVTEIEQGFNKLVEGAVTDPKSMEAIKNVIELSVELKKVIDEYASAVAGGKFNEVTIAKGKVTVLKPKVVEALAHAKKAGNISGVSDAEAETHKADMAKIIDLIRPSHERALAVSSARAKITRPTVDVHSLQPLLASLRSLTKHGENVIGQFTSVKQELDKMSKSRVGWDGKALSGNPAAMKDIAEANGTINEAIGFVNAQYHSSYAHFGTIGKAIVAYLGAVNATKQLLQQDTVLMTHHGNFLMKYCMIGK